MPSCHSLIDFFCTKPSVIEQEGFQTSQSMAFELLDDKSSFSENNKH